MRRIFVIAMAAACGGSIPSVQATQQIKDGAAQAQQGLQSSNAGTLSAIGMENLAGALVGVSNVAGLDLTSLPDPLALSKQASAPPRHVQGAVAPGRSAEATSVVTGCIKPDPDALPGGKFTAGGQTGCDATDHLEIDYINGDQLNLSFSGTATTFDLNASMSAGAWAGTTLDYAATSLGNNQGVTVHTTGSMKYNGDIDTDFDFTYQITQNADSGGFSSSLQSNGTSTDRLVAQKLSYGWRTTIQLDGHNQVAGLQWTGNQEISLLTAAGTVQDTVKFSNVNVRAALQGSATAITGFTASGDVLWNGARAGTIVAKDAQNVAIRWTDGTESKIDPVALFGSPLS